MEKKKKEKQNWWAGFHWSGARRRWREEVVAEVGSELSSLVEFFEFDPKAAHFVASEYKKENY